MDQLHGPWATETSQFYLFLTDAEVQLTTLQRETAVAPIPWPFLRSRTVHKHKVIQQNLLKKEAFIQKKNAFQSTAWTLLLGGRPNMDLGSLQPKQSVDVGTLAVAGN